MEDEKERKNLLSYRWKKKLKDFRTQSVNELKNFFIRLKLQKKESREEKKVWWRRWQKKVSPQESGETNRIKLYTVLCMNSL